MPKIWMPHRKQEAASVSKASTAARKLRSQPYMYGIVALVWLLYAAPLIGFKPFLGSQIANCHQHCVLISAENDENFYKIH